MEPRLGRRGDSVAISGSYQHDARTKGFVVQRFWHAEKERVIRKFCPPEKDSIALDVGCGSGVISNLLATLGANTVGIDGNENAIAYAQRTFHQDGLSFRRCQVEDLDFANESVDFAYCMEVVEHLYAGQVDRLLRRLYELAKPGGRLMLTTPNYGGTWPVVEFILDALRLVPRLAGDQHVTKFDRRRIDDALSRAGWRVNTVTTFSTVAPFVSALSWRMALALSSLEDRFQLPFGNVILAVATKDGV